MKILAILFLTIPSVASGEANRKLEAAVRTFVESDVVSHVEIESVEIVHVSEASTIFRIEARVLESFRREDPSSALCYHSHHENPVKRFPQPGDRLIVGLLSIPKNVTCYGLDTGHSIPEDDAHINLMRALRDVNEL